MKNKLGLAFLKYLRFFAKIQLLKNKNAKIIGITASAGKTSTRDAVYAVLNKKNKIKITKKANSESGIPMHILGIESKGYSFFNWLRVAFLAPLKLITNWEKFDYYIVEMGIDSPNPPKNMEFLLSIIRPQISIFLNAGLAHSEPFDHLVKEINPKKREQLIITEIAKEKAKLVNQLDKNGFAILNFDDKNVKETCQKTKAHVCSIGQNKSNDISLLFWKVDWTSKKPNTIFKFQIQNGFGNLAASKKKENEIIEIKIKNYLMAEHYAYSLAAAIAIGFRAGLSSEEIKDRLENNFQLPAGRSSLLDGIKNSLIVDSSYNASSMMDLIELIDKSKSKNRKIAVLGDIRELGDETTKTHQEIAKKAAEVFDIVYLVGPLMREHALPILKKEINKKIEEVASFDEAKTAGLELKEIIKDKDLILFKGSQNTIYLEEALTEILKNPEDKNKLCRQDDYWQKTKNSFFLNFKG